MTELAASKPTSRQPKPPLYTLKGPSGPGAFCSAGNSKKFRVTQPLITPLPQPWESVRASDRGETTTYFESIDKAVEYLAGQHANTPGGIRVKFGNSLADEQRSEALPKLEEVNIPLKKPTVSLRHYPASEGYGARKEYFGISFKNSLDTSTCPTSEEAMEQLETLNRETIGGVRVELEGWFPAPLARDILSGLASKRIELKKSNQIGI